MAGGAEGVAAAHNHRILRKEVHELGEGQESPLFLVGLQPPVQLQDSLQGTDGQDVAALRHIGLHAGEDLQAVFQL